MGDEKSHNKVLGRGFLPLRDGIDQNFTVISGLVAHILIDFLHENMCFASFDPLEYPKISYFEEIYDQSHVYTDFSVQYQPHAMVFITFLCFLSIQESFLLKNTIFL